MEKQGFRAIIFIATAIVSAAAYSADAAVQLRLKLDKGKTYYHRTVLEQKITQTVMGQQQVIEQSIGTGLKLHVLDVEARGSMRVQYTYLWSRCKSSNPMAPLDYDSARQAPVPPGAEGFAALLGQGYILELSPQGKVLKVEGLKEFQEAVRKKLPAGSEGSPTMQTLSPFFDEQQIRQTTEAGMAVYPEGPVEPGGSWTEKMTLTMGFLMDVESKWTLQKREAGVATVAESGSLRSNPSGPPLEAAGMRMKFEGGGTHEGTMLIDESTGLITSTKAHQRIEGEIKFGSAPEGPFDMMVIPSVFDTQVVAGMSDKMWETAPQ